MLDAFTAAMCKDPWGRIGFARTLIEVSVAKELKQEVTMAVPHEDGTGHTKVLIKAEYEWKPPLCGDCHMFGHLLAQCPKRVVATILVTEEAKSKGFTTITNKRRKGKKQVNNTVNKPVGVGHADDIKPQSLWMRYMMMMVLPRKKEGESSRTEKERWKALPSNDVHMFISRLNIRDEEATYVQALTEAKLDEERFLKQKAKIEWLEVRDSNSAFFNIIRLNSYVLVLGYDRAPDSEGLTSAFFKRAGMLWVLIFVMRETWPTSGGSNFSLFIYFGYGGLDSYYPTQDDIFIFARGELDSARLIIESLDEFQKSIGPVPVSTQSTHIICNVRNHVKHAILNLMPFAEGELPVKYLGVPLISTRLLNRDYTILVERVLNRIGDWKKNRYPLRDVFNWQHMRGFLWCNGELKRGKAKVAWDAICLLKHEGGLGIRSLEQFNIALMMTHIRNIVKNKQSLWVQWIHIYKSRGRTIGDPNKADMSLGKKASL
ncbi:hypothetical protein Tco_1136242 [Tanacetum coccineum]